LILSFDYQAVSLPFTSVISTKMSKIGLIEIYDISLFEVIKKFYLIIRNKRHFVIEL